MAVVIGGFLRSTDNKKLKKTLLKRLSRCSFSDPFQKSVNKHGSYEWELPALYGHEEILLLLQKKKVFFSETAGQILK